MTRVGSSLALALLVAWMVQSLAMVALAPLAATLLGVATGAAAVAATRSKVIGGARALLAPCGVMLPALARGAMAARLGVDLPGFSAVELAVFLAGYTVFLLCAFGVIQFDLYRLGYAPGPVAGMVLGMCAYAGLTGHWGLAVVAVLGQVFWVMKWGSSNWFDYVLHFLLWPIAAVALVASAF